MNYWHKVKDKQSELNDLRENGNQQGYTIGWDIPITVKLGCTTYIAGAPHDGKTEFWLDVLVNLSVEHKLKHVIFTPETGTTADIIAELCTKYVGKPYIKKFPGAMTETEKINAEMFVAEYFYIIDPLDNRLTAETFFNIVDKIEQTENVTIHTTLIDPFNELAHDFSKDEGRQDLYIERILGDIRKNARAKERHNCVITHVRDQAPIIRSGKTFFPMPTPREIAGGQAWFRKGLLMIIIWRPPEGLNNENGEPYKSNEVFIKVAKSKPKGVSKNGIYKMFYDIKKNTYYLEGGIYAKRHKNPPVEKQSKMKIENKLVNWYETEKDEDYS